MITFLEPEDIEQLIQAYSQSLPEPAPDAGKLEIDFIHRFMGHPNLTHAWNEFGLKAEVVERVSRS